MTKTTSHAIFPLCPSVSQLRRSKTPEPTPKNTQPKTSIRKDEEDGGRRVVVVAGVGVVAVQNKATTVVSFEDVERENGGWSRCGGGADSLSLFLPTPGPRFSRKGARGKFKTKSLSPREPQFKPGFEPFTGWRGGGEDTYRTFFFFLSADPGPLFFLVIHKSWRRTRSIPEDIAAH